MTKTTNVGFRLNTKLLAILDAARCDGETRTDAVERLLRLALDCPVPSAEGNRINTLEAQVAEVIGRVEALEQTPNKRLTPAKRKPKAVAAAKPVDTVATVDSSAIVQPVPNDAQGLDGVAIGYECRKAVAARLSGYEKDPSNLNRWARSQGHQSADSWLLSMGWEPASYRNFRYVGRA